MAEKAPKKPVVPGSIKKKTVKTAAAPISEEAKKPKTEKDVPVKEVAPVKKPRAPRAVKEGAVKPPLRRASSKVLKRKDLAEPAAPATQSFGGRRPAVGGTPAEAGVPAPTAQSAEVMTPVEVPVKPQVLETVVPPSAPEPKPAVKAPEPQAAPALEKAVVPDQPKPTPPAAVPAPVAKAPAAPVSSAATGAAKKKIVLTPDVTVKDLALKLNVSVADLIKKLMSLGVWATINQRLDKDVAGLIVSDFGAEAEFPSAFETEAALSGPPEEVAPEDLAPRPPIVTIMGHVDHGKTTLLDAIRETNVAEKEAGGITQHISAFRVKTPRGDIVFLDTPGHEAFTAMRARGAKVTDLVILVVAADDGVMPQTVEAVDHAKAGGVKIVVAINKIDKPEANTNRIKQELANLGLSPEEWGGNTVMVEVSAKRKMNIDKLLEMVLLEAELMELKASPKRSAVATVMEARKDPKRGTVASILVSDGTIRVGEPFICGATWGRVRALIDDHNVKLTQVGPATPVLALGFDGLPQAGDRLLVVKNERQAKELAARRQAELEAVRGKTSTRHLTLEDLHEKIEQGLVKEFKIVLRTDTQGSLEALVGELSKLRHEEVVISVIHSGVGTISLSDVLLAAASDAVVLGFNVSVDPRGKEEAKKEDVELREYSVIYELIEDIKAALEGLLAPIIKENITGGCEVRAAFKVSGVGKVAGCFVTDGKLTKDNHARVSRDGNKIIEGKIFSLKRVKEDVREVIKGLECGVMISGYNDPRKGDRIEAYEQVKELKKLRPATIA